MESASAQYSRLTFCPQCSYDLRGLPAIHACPECGFAYDASMFLLDGWTLPALSTGAIWRLVVAIAATVLFLASVFNWLWISALMVFLLCLAVLAGLYMLVRQQPDSGEHVIVRYLVSRDGVSMLGGPLHRWSEYSHLALLQKDDGSWRLILYPRWSSRLRTLGLNAHLECSMSEAESLRNEVQQRITESKRKHVNVPR